MSATAEILAREKRAEAGPVRCSIIDGIATIVLENPPLNVVTRPLTLALGETLNRLEADESVRVVIVTGAGNRAFCAGSDITEFAHDLAPGEIVREQARAPERDLLPSRRLLEAHD